MKYQCVTAAATGLAACALISGQASAGVTATPGTLTPAIYDGGDDINGFDLTSPGNYSYKP